ncbi:redoxin domain-containing protein [Actinoplanes sp. NPDC049316]|uniref:redoxin domain-containing protein n=1 Tax=Actinoplanes sp. NPDC049316 TaxID=3154727 RepID=UPI0034405A15
MTTTSAYRRPATDLAFRQQLERDAIWSRMIAPGGRIPDLALVEADLGPIHLHRLLDTGPLVLVFFRHAASAGCDAALAAYGTRLAPVLDGLDAHLVAVSPQRADRLAALKRRHELGFLVAADARHALIDAFGIGFSSPETVDVLGTGRSTLPYPAVVVADRSGVVRYVDVRPDAAVRTDPADIIAAVRNLRPAR